MFKSISATLMGLALGIGAMASPALALPDMSNSVAGNYQGMNYRVMLPANYNASEKLPVILFLHGAPGRGTSGLGYMDGVDPLFNTVNTTGAYRAIVVAPQCAPGDAWAAMSNYYSQDNWNLGAYHEPAGGLPAQTASMTKALAIFDNVVSQYNGDTRREYITGLSMGGYGTWDAIARYPNKFAAAAPLSGGGDLDSVNKIKNIPIWAYHGLGDTIVTESGTIDMINALHAVQNPNDPKYAEVTLKGGKGHQGWDYFYTDLSDKTKFDWQSYVGSDGQFFYQWLFSQQLAVPEPGTISLMGLACIGLLRRRRVA